MDSSQGRAAARRVGTTIGKYTIDAVLGIGGMATVFRGVHRNGHRVALKLLQAELAADEELRLRFVQEAYVANSIDHAGVVHVLDDDETDDATVYLVLELLDGETLDARAARQGGTLPVGEVVALSIELLDVLAAAHAAGVVHRDIKPANLMVTVDGSLKVLDFGIARVQSTRERAVAETAAGRAMGTPAFMPPEQALGRQQEIDARTDVWAVGATMFHLLTGRYVHEAGSGAALMVAAATKPAPPILTVGPSLPDGLARIVDQALSFEREARFSSAREMRDALLAQDLASSRDALRRVPEHDAEEAGRTLDLHLPSDVGSDASGAEDPTVAAPAGAAPTLRSATAARRSRAAAPTTPARDALALVDARDQDQAAQARAAPPSSPTTPAPTVPTPDEAPAPQEPRPDAVRPQRRAWALGGIVVAALAAAGATAIGGRSEVSPPSIPAPSAVSSGAALPSCTRHAECTAALGEAARCHRGACAALRTPGCTLLGTEAEATSDDAVLLGALYHFESNVVAADLARRDIAEVTAGLPPRRPGETRRPLTILACVGADQPEPTVRHMVDALGVPVVLGFPDSRQALDLATAVLQPQDVLGLAGNQSIMLADLPRPPGAPRALFRVSPSARDFAKEMGRVAARAAERGPARPRVALTRVDNHTGVSYAELFTANLQVRGRTVPELGTDFLQIIAPSELGGAALGEVARDKLLAFRPTLILQTAGLMDLVEAVERQWPREAPRPTWVNLGMYTPEDAVRVTALRAALGEVTPPIEARLLGVDTSVGHSALAKYVARHNELHERTISRYEAASFPYDAVYLAAYLIAARGDGALDAPSLIAELPRLMRGPRVDVGQAGLPSTFSALTSGGSVDLVGTITSLDFDLETGDPEVDLSIFCFADESGSLGVVESASDSGCVAR